MNSHSRIKDVTEHYFNLKEYYEVEVKGDNNLVPTVSIVHRYFEDGRKIETEYFMDGNPDYTTIYKYNIRNQLTETIDILPSGIPRNKSTINYDLNGQKKETTVYFGMENIDFIIGYSYNEKSQLISESYTYPNNRGDIITFYDYRNNGREVISTSKDKVGEIIWKLIELRDEEGNVVLCKSFDGGGALVQETIYKYDDLNNLTTKVIRNYSKSRLIEEFQSNYKYAFDDKKNWVRKEWFADNEEFSSVTIREIVYY